MLKRQKQVTVRFTEEEYHQLKNKCDAAGMKMEPFLRIVNVRGEGYKLLVNE